MIQVTENKEAETMKHLSRMEKKKSRKVTEGKIQLKNAIFFLNTEKEKEKTASSTFKK